MFKRVFLLLMVATSLTCTGCGNLPTVNTSAIKVTTGDEITFNQSSGAGYLTMTVMAGDKNRLVNFLNTSLHNATIEGRYTAPRNIKVRSLTPDYIGINEGGKQGAEIRILQYQTYTTSKLENGVFVQAHNVPNELLVYMPKHTPVIVKSQALYALLSRGNWSGYFQKSN